MKFETTPTSEPVIDYGSVREFEKSFLEASGIKGALAFVFDAASKAAEDTVRSASNVTESVVDSLTKAMPAPTPIAGTPPASPEGSAK